MAKKRGLGRGLGALIPPSAEEPASQQTGVTEITIEQIRPNPRQPRHTLDEEKLQELAASIQEHGLIQPLVVTGTESGYQLIAGERRWRAARIAGLETIPVIIKETSPQQMLELALVENIQRADLNPLEEAEAYNELMEQFGLTQEAVAERIGKSRTAVANTVRLLNLPDEAKEKLAAGDISEGHARALLSLKNRADRLETLQTILDQKLNVRQTEALVRRLLAGEAKPAPSRSPGLSPQDKNLVNRFASRLGTKVELNRTAEDRGKLVIHFYSQEELQAIYEAILGQDEAL